MKRKPFLDNLRFVTVLLVVCYHAFYLFNSVGVLGGLSGWKDVQYQDAVLYAVYPWFMVLLFLISGICARYALRQRTNREFQQERTVKLLVPSTLGLLCFHWLTGFWNLKIAGAWESIGQLPFPVRYVICAVSGIGPLWFAQMLWMFSVLTPLFPQLKANNWNLWKLLGLVLPIWLSAQLGNVPVITVYRFGIYFCAYYLGYAVFYEETVQTLLEQYRLPLGIAAILFGAGYIFYYFGTDYTAPQCLQSLWTAIYLWTAILAILGNGKHFLNRPMRYASHSFGIYVLHYPFQLMISWYLKLLGCPAALAYLLSIVGTLLAVLVCETLISKIPVMRFCVLGLRGRKNEISIHR